MIDHQPSFLGSATSFDAVIGTERSCELIVTEKYTLLIQPFVILLSIASLFSAHASIFPGIPAQFLRSTFRDVLQDRLLRVYVDGGEGGGSADDDGKDSI